MLVKEILLMSSGNRGSLFCVYRARIFIGLDAGTSAVRPRVQLFASAYVAGFKRCECALH